MVTDMTKLRKVVALPLLPLLLFDLVSWSGSPLLLFPMAIGVLLQLEVEQAIRGWTRGPLLRSLPQHRYGAWLLAATLACVVLITHQLWSATLAWGLITLTGVAATLQRTLIDRVIVTATIVIAVLLPVGLWGDGAEVFLMILTLGACTIALVVGTMVRNQEDRVQHAGELMRIEERAKMSVDLHDLVAHEVTGIVVLAQAAGAVARDPRDATAFARIETAAQQALSQIRTLVAQENETARTDPDAGLTSLRDLADRFAATSSAQVTVALSEDEPPSVVAALLQRALAESLTNIRRHAQPTRVSIDLFKSDQAWRLLVRNDGATNDGIGVGNNSGLARLRERAELLGGGFRAELTEPDTWESELWLPAEVRR
jgi:signal transduction histidine kinase